jgi:hypothetical protein
VRDFGYMRGLRRDGLGSTIRGLTGGGHNSVVAFRGHYTPRATPIAGFDLQRHKPNCFTCNCGCSTAICSFTIGSLLVPEGLRYSTLAIGVVLGVYKARTGHLLGII